MGNPFRRGAALIGAALLACGTGEDPASVCAQLGTLHRDSRARLEKLRTSEMVSRTEWECMARELSRLDDELTGRCGSSAVTLGQVREGMLSAYAGCLASPSDAVLGQAVPRRLAPR